MGRKKNYKKNLQSVGVQLLSLLRCAPSSVRSSSLASKKYRASKAGRKLSAEQLESRQLFAGLVFESAFAIGDGMNATIARRGVIIDDSGNSYISGYFQGVVDFAPSHTLPGDTDILASTGSLRDLFVAKYDANDQLLWAKGFGSSNSAAEAINKMALDSFGNIYAVGQFQETLTLDNLSVSSAGFDDGFLLKLDADGNTQWLSRWGTSVIEAGNGVAISPSGDVYTVGRQKVDTNPTTPSTVGTQEIRKVDPATGSVLWMKSVEPSAGSSMIDVDSQGNVNLVGTFTNAFDADPGPGQVLISPGIGSGSTYAIQLNSDGNLNWALGFELKTPTDPSMGSFAYAYGFAVDMNDNLVITGQHWGRVDFDPSSTRATELSEKHRSFVVKLSSGGDFKWVGGVTGSQNHHSGDLKFDSANNLILAGLFIGYSEALDFDPGVGTAYLTPLNNGGPNYDGFIWSLTEAGEFRSITQFATPNLSIAVAGIGIDTSGGIHAVGSFTGQADLDPGPGVFTLSTTSRSAFSMRLDTLPGVTVNRRVGHVTSELGQSTSFEVSLDSRPSENVYLPLSSSDLSEGTVNVVGLHFTPDNWNIPQLVTVAGVNDSSFDGDVAYAIVLGTLVSNDPAYAGINPTDVAVTNLDDEVLTTKFYVVDDATANRTFEYAQNGSAVENYSLNGGNSSPRGAASTVAGDKVWVVDANKKIYVYNNSGVLLGSWTAGSIASNATIEGITTNGTDVWLVDARQDRVYRYANAASRLSGSQNATSSFALNSGNRSPKDLVTDGSNIWVVESNTTDRVFKYSMTGSLVGNWVIDTANASPTGITLDPSGATQSLWIVDNGSDRVYEYTNARTRNSGSQSAAVSFALSAGNLNPQGIADPPVADSSQADASVDAILTAPPSNQSGAPGIPSSGHWIANIGSMSNTSESNSIESYEPLNANHDPLTSWLRDVQFANESFWIDVAETLPSSKRPASNTRRLDDRHSDSESVEAVDDFFADADLLVSIAGV